MSMTRRPLHIGWAIVWVVLATGAALGNEVIDAPMYQKPALPTPQVETVLEAPKDLWLEALRRLPPGKERAALDRSFHRFVHEDQPYAFLGSPEIDSLVAARVHDFAPSAAGLGLPLIRVDP